MKLPVYMDNHSTTQLDPRVFSAMQPYFLEKYGNPSNKGHTFGWEASSAVENARRQIADFINSSPEEIYFTSGTTESVNLVHFGIAEARMSRGNHIITSAIEHPAVINSLKLLEEKGFQVTSLPVDRNGLIDPEQLQKLITERTIMVSIMAANNEIGIINDISAIGKICREWNISFHTDAAQAVGKINLDVQRMNITAASFSAHKIYGPKGIGALFVKKGLKLTPQVYGGGQEKGLRGGTLNVPSIVGFGRSLEISSVEMNIEQERVAALRDLLYREILGNLEDVHLNGSIENRLYNNLNLRFGGIRSEDLLLELREIALSAGSACASESLKPSHVLKAIGLTDQQAKSSVRLGLGRFTTGEEIKYVSNRIIESVIKLRSISPLTKIKANENE